MPSKTIEDFAYQIKDYMRGAEVVTGKNLMSSDVYMLGTSDAELGASTFTTSSAGVGFVAKLKQNTDYVISRVGGNRSRIALSVNVPIVGGACNIINLDNDVTEKSFNSGSYNYVYIYASNTSETYETIQPMVCTDAEWTRSNTFEPYYVPVKDSKMSWEDQGMLGAINYLPRSYNGGTTQGVTYAINADEELTATWSSTPTGSAIITYMSARTLNLKAGKRYKVTGCPSGGGWSTNNLKYRIYLYDSLTSLTVAVDTGDGAEFMATNTGYAFFVVIGTDAGASGSLTFKPMISLADANLSYDDFQPYAMTNKKLTDAVTEIDTRLSVGTIVANSSLNNYYKTGDYYSNTGSNTATLSDKPSDLAGAFRLSVICANFPVGQGNNETTSPITQKIELINGTTPCIYMRHKTGGGSTWGSWYKFTGTELQ